jgi:DNA repair protein RadA/Sms
MAARTSQFVCSACGATYPKWLGRCGKCNEFGTISEGSVTVASKAGSVGIKGDMRAAAVARPARRVNDIDTTVHRHTSTGIGELDRVLGGGLIAGQAILLAGEPGVGKSTLLLETANNYAKTGKTVLYVSGEESAEQITLRARRTGADADTLLIADETDLSVVLGHIEQTSPDLVIVDSVQTIASPDVDGRAGGVSQVQEVSATLTRVAKASHIPILVVAQVTKDGNIAGPKTLEHLVDTVLFFEGDRNTNLRLLRTIKNRFGASDEVAAFEQTETGIKEVPDPSGLFRTNREEPAAGTAITVTMEGRRALLAEVQALVSPTNAPNPRRGVSGLDTARMAMLVAVTEKHGRIRMFDKDTFLATVAGMKITEPAADLAVCLALASAAWNAPMPQDVAAIGEVALSGDIRSVSNMSQRLNEAARLGFQRILVPTGTQRPNGSKLTLIEVPHLGRAFAALRQMAPAVTSDSNDD